MDNLKARFNEDLRDLKSTVMLIKSNLYLLDNLIDNLYYSINKNDFDYRLSADNYFKMLQEDDKK